GLIHLAQPRSRLNQRIEHYLQIKSRAADDLKHVSSRSLLLKRFAQLIEEPRVLDGDDGLGGKVLNQLDLLVCKWTNLLSVKKNSPLDFIVLEQRYAQDSADAANFNGGNRQRFAIGIRLRCGDIADMNDLFCRGDATDNRLW